MDATSPVIVSVLDPLAASRRRDEWAIQCGLSYNMDCTVQHTLPWRVLERGWYIHRATVGSAEKRGVVFDEKCFRV